MFFYKWLQNEFSKQRGSYIFDHAKSPTIVGLMEAKIPVVCCILKHALVANAFADMPLVCILPTFNNSNDKRADCFVARWIYKSVGHCG